MNSSPKNSSAAIAQESSLLADDMQDEGPGLLDYWRIIMRYKWSIICLALLGVLVGGITAYSTVPVYRADSTILIEPGQPKITNISQLEGNSSILLFYETQYEIIRSRSITEKVIDTLRLEEQVPGVLGELTHQEKKAALVELIQANLSVKGGKLSQIVSISYESDDPQFAAKIANAITKAYIEQGLEARLTTVKQATSWLSGRLGGLRGQVDASEDALRNYQLKEEMIATNSRQNIINARSVSATTGLVEAQTERSEAEIHYNQVRRVLQDGSGSGALVHMLDSPTVLMLSDEVANLNRKISELSERYGVKHPKMLAVKSDRKDVQQRLKAEINKAVSGIRTVYEGAVDKEREMKRSLDRLQHEMREFTGKAFQLAKLEREVEANREIYETFLARFKEISVEKENNLSNARVIDAAEVPLLPYKPNKKRIMLVSLILGLFGGIALAFVRARMDNTFNTSEQVEEKLMLPVLSMIPKLNKSDGDPDRQSITNPRTTFAEAMNAIRTGIIYSRIDDPIKTIMVTSAVPGEGKTTLSINLATSFSKLGRTLLIDLDLRKGRLGQAFGITENIGLMEWMMKKDSLEKNLVQDKEQKSLYVMPCVTKPRNPLEMVSSQTFQTAFAELKEQFDYIVIDTPPVLAVSDAIVISHLADGVILSLKASATTQHMAQDALKRLSSSGQGAMGVVMAMVDFRKLSSYYGSYYGSDYGSYHEPIKNKA